MKKTILSTVSAVALFLLMAHSPAGYEVGDTVNNFKLKNVDGKYISLLEYADKGAIVIFDCNTCPYSKGYNERILSLHKKFKDKGYPVVTINSNDPKISPGDSFDEMVSYAKKKGYNFPYLYDESQEVAKSFGASNTPHVYVVKKEQDVLKVAYIGAIDNNSKDAGAADKKYVEDAVNALIEGKSVSTPKTKAIGCSIKYRS